MQISPRYDGPPVLLIDLPLGDPAVPLLRQRRRLVAALGELDERQWAAPSRCTGWSTQDVVSHLVSTNQFWTMSITAGRAGAPTRFLEGFDPVATPAQLVTDARGTEPVDVLKQLVESTDALEDAVQDLSADEWSTVVAEAPPGHMALADVALHALWDGWVHERDVLLPLGLPVVDEPDEIVGCLGYVAALSPSFLAIRGSERQGSLVIEGTDPDVVLVVEAGPTVRAHAGPAPEGAPRLRGRSVDLVEGLSLRAPLEAAVGDDVAWMLAGLGTVFEQST